MAPDSMKNLGYGSHEENAAMTKAEVVKEKEELMEAAKEMKK